MLRARPSILLPALLLGPGAAAPAVPAAAQEARAVDARQQFDLPAQPLAAALRALATASHINIVFEPERVAGLRSRPLRGAFTPEAALSILLADSGLAATFIGPRSAVIHGTRERAPAGAAPARARRTAAATLQLDMAEVRAAPSIGRPDRRFAIDYARRAQDEIRSVLGRDPAYRTGTFRVRIAVTSDPAGRIAAVRVVRGSGDGGRDRRLPEMLAGHRLAEPPPAGMVQPMWFDIAVDGQESRRQEARAQ